MSEIDVQKLEINLQLKIDLSKLSKLDAWSKGGWVEARPWPRPLSNLGSLEEARAGYVQYSCQYERI